MNQEQEIIIKQKGSLGIITLNRPQALNALSYNMIQRIATQLERWRDDSGIKAVLFKGAGERAFCAGGDIKAAYYAGLAFKANSLAPSPASYFHEEYLFNKMLFHYSKPLIAFMDGITMGGGYGIAGNCRYRIATPKTVFAMPETGIGFFPDVGAAYHLARSRGRSGLFLGVTGISVSGADMMYAGLADYYITQDEVSMINALCAEDDLKAALAKLHVAPLEGEILEAQARVIDTVFASNDIEQILRDHGDSALCQIIFSRSPTSVKLAARHVSEAVHKTFDETIAQDFSLACHCIAGDDFYEGVRAAVIDKDKAPHWKPARLEDVSEAMLERYFQPIEVF